MSSAQDREDPGNDPIARLTAVTKRYHSGKREFVALDDVSIEIGAGEWLAIVGPSGSGKSTLLNIIAGIDSADAGDVWVAGRRLNGLGENQLAAWRGREVGIVFQFFQLMPTLNVVENVMLPMDLAGLGHGRHERAMALLDRVGIAHLALNLPSELSGGEQQRAAIARALANAPSILLADEPTGNLDSATGERIVDLLADVWQSGTTIVMVTHDADVAARATRMINMLDGRIVRDTAALATAPAAGRAS
ncbi:MAG TPA: ABC transporter ATP-binding protein [Thermomicrobiales bacterium]|nr:ABC transporter ATP-binding protein [Thermomicrobiales bacterium]